MRRVSSVLLGLMCVAGACAPKAPPLSGTIAPVSIPSASLPPLHRKLVFKWHYRDPNVDLRGEGAARIAPPDSARMDFFLANGMGSGRALLIGDEVRTPGAEMLRKLLPPPALLWAALGRLSLGSPPDTVVRVDSDTIRADIGRQPRWRAAFAGGSLRRLEMIEGGRIRQWVAREPPPGGAVRYRHERDDRVLEMTVTRTDTVAAFDEAIWH